jgi:hypothetical protein
MSITYIFTIVAILFLLPIILIFILMNFIYPEYGDSMLLQKVI